jgi:hypothetical protein
MFCKFLLHKKLSAVRQLFDRSDRSNPTQFIDQICGRYYRYTKTTNNIISVD